MLPETKKGKLLNYFGIKFQFQRVNSFDYEVAFPGVRVVYSTMKPEELKALAKARAKAAPKNGPKGPQTPPELQDMLMKMITFHT